jgi:hypothetical protein
MMVSVLACREGSSWVVQALEEDVASQGQSLLDALVDLGRMFDARDAILTAETNAVAIPRAPAEYTRAFSQGHYVGLLPLGAVRVAQVYIGISPFEQKKQKAAEPSTTDETLRYEVRRLTLLSDAWRQILDVVDPEARERAICRTCPSNECQIRERCTSATACRSLYNLAASSRPAP